MSMKSRFTQSDTEPMLRNLSAMKLQQWGRMLMVRRAFYHLFVLEDKVLLRPKPGSLAMKFLLPEESDSRPSSSSNSATANASGQVGKIRAGADRLGAKDQRITSKDQRLGSKAQPVPAVSLPVLAGHFQKSGWYAPSSSPELDPNERAAKAIFKLLSVPYHGALQEGHLDQIYRHHRIQWRIKMSATNLRFILMRHGESSWAVTRGDSADSPPGSPMAAHARTLRPEGWSQVTRTAWTLRLCQEWQPEVLLTSSLPCCRQTIERVRSVLDDPDLRDGAVPGAIQEPTPATFLCKTLDFPDREGSLGLQACEVAEAVQQVVKELEVQSGERPLRPRDVEASPPPKILMLVTGGAAAESLLGYLTSGIQRKYLDQLLIGAGDAMLLESPTLHRLVGDGNQERVRPESELWQAGLSRNKWKVLRHIRGDGNGVQLGALPKTIQELNEETDRKIKAKVMKPKFAASSHVDGGLEVFSETRAAFRRYAGEPMIFSHREFSKLCWRAGKTELPLESDFCVKVKPLVFGFKFSSPVGSKSEQG